MGTTAPATTKLLTADEFWEYVHRPENEHRHLDLIRGVLVEMSRPTRPHGIVCAEITRLLGNWVATGKPGYIASNDAGVVLRENPDSVVGPDVAYYTDANTFEDVHPKWGDVPPVLAVEVMSPNDKIAKLNNRTLEYLAGGTKLVWLVDYEERWVTVYRPDRAMVVLKGEAILDGNPELPGFSCKVSDFFRAAAQAAVAPPT